ncbi:MAG: hypothetical protein N2595_05900 [bacterium]|nr:hypothetical protein [bacterium]
MNMDTSHVPYPEFLSPSAAWRGKPFWSWNGRLQKDELLRQVHVLHAMGFGGFFMHSRVGLVTEYLGPEWFELINACADEGARLGMEAWLYDEDRWPSGSAGGEATRDPRNRQKFLYLRIMTPRTYVPSEHHIALFTCVLRNTYDCYAAQRVTVADLPHLSPDATLLVFGVHQHAPSTFYNGFTYLDTLNPAATRAFLEITHERYARYCDTRLGTSIKGIFTDEPTCGALFNDILCTNDRPTWQCPWTDALPAAFHARFGTDLIAQLPALFLQPEGRRAHPVKWQYVELIVELYLDNFAQLCWDWCRQHKLFLTGHILEERTLLTQAVACGSPMRYYERMDYPGIDVLTEGLRNYWIPMLAASVARQTGKPFVLSELYGCTGWQFDFQAHKAVGDWQTLLGVNLRCHHLSWYTMAGEAKRDYPASILHQSAWWCDYHVVEDYFARFGYLLSQGSACNEVLVLYPVESLWCQMRVDFTEADPVVQQLQEQFRTLNTWLLAAHIGFDYGDEEMLARLHNFATGADGAPRLLLGLAAYRVAIVAGMTTIRSSTLAILSAFANRGGRVIFVGEPPSLLDAVPSDAPRELAARCLHVPWQQQALADACRAVLPFALEVRHPNGTHAASVLATLRRDGPRWIIGLVNTDRSHPSGPLLVVLRGARGTVEEYDCLTGERFATPAEETSTTLTLTTDCAPAGSRVFVVHPHPHRLSSLPTRPRWQETRRHEIPGPFSFDLTEPNVAVLDFARWQLNDEAWHAPEDILKIDRAVRQKLGLEPRGGMALQPWFKLKYAREQASAVRGTVRLQFSFDVRELPETDCLLCMETPHSFCVTLNNQPISFPERPQHWIDVAFETTTVPGHLFRLGTNVISLEAPYTDMSGLEAIYLLGSFGVEAHPQRALITRLPRTLAPACLTAQGLPFYSGAVRYQLPAPPPPHDGEHVFLELPAHAGACVNIYDESGKIACLPWAPHEVDITPALHRGAHKLIIEVVLPRRNTFGPLHQLGPRDMCHPGSFLTEGEWYTPAYVLHPAGLLAPPVCSYRRLLSSPSPAL